MRRTIAVGCCTVLCMELGGTRLNATHPVSWYDLEMLPALSTLTVAGGLAGVQETYRVDGQLGLNFDPHPHPPDVANAQFGLVDATLHGDGFFDGQNLDELLAMTDWQGILVDDDLLSFTGEDGQQAPIAAIADFNNSRLRLRGRNVPGCCDFFYYTWDLFAITRAPDHGHAHADFDEDGDVDGDDLLRSLVHFGKETEATHALGDADADGDVDRLDVRIWQATVGTEFTQLYPSSNTTVPEPTSFVIAILPFAAFVGRLARRRIRGGAQR